MICKRLFPAEALRPWIREYVVAQFRFEDKSPPLLAYPANPDEAIRFILAGNLVITHLGTNETQLAPPIAILGQPTVRQNLQISPEYSMFYIRFQPGSLFKLYGIPMTMLKDLQSDATSILGREIEDLFEETGNCPDFPEMIRVVESYFMRKIAGLKDRSQPIDQTAKAILQNPQGFSLDRAAREAFLSHGRLEKRFEQLVGITPKYFARITRFYQAFMLRENHPALDWLSIAVRTGYNDYQHMVKDFKEFSGSTPNSLMQQRENSPANSFATTRNFKGV